MKILTTREEVYSTLKGLLEQVKDHSTGLIYVYSTAGEIARDAGTFLHSIMDRFDDEEVRHLNGCGIVDGSQGLHATTFWSLDRPMDHVPGHVHISAEHVGELYVLRFYSPSDECVAMVSIDQRHVIITDETELKCLASGNGIFYRLGKEFGHLLKD